MADIVVRLRNAIHHESAAISPMTTELIEAAREAAYEIERLRQECVHEVTLRQIGRAHV